MAWVARGKCKALGTKKSSTPAVVPGAAPALAKAGVGGFCFMHLQRRSFRGSLTLLYSDFRVVAEICPDLFRFLQCSHEPGCSYPQPLII